MSNISKCRKSANQNRKLALLWCAVHIDISAFSFYTHRLIGYFYEFSKSYRIDLTILSHAMRHILWALDLKYFHSFSNVRLLVDATAFFLPNEIKRLIYFRFDAISAHLTVSASLSIRLNSTLLFVWMCCCLQVRFLHSKIAVLNEREKFSQEFSFRFVSFVLNLMRTL